MIGNDIVDLSISYVGTGERRERYVRKLFTDSEIILLDKLGIQDRWIWLLWSIKESVYKIIVRDERRIRYAPKTIVCIKVEATNSNRYKCMIQYEGKAFKALSTVYPECIHTIAFKSGIDANSIVFDVFKKPQNSGQSLLNDDVILSSISDKKSYNNSLLSIERDGFRIPRVFDDGNERGVLSLSGDGAFFGYGYLSNFIQENNVS